MDWAVRSIFSRGGTHPPGLMEDFLWLEHDCGCTEAGAAKRRVERRGCLPAKLDEGLQDSGAESQHP